MTGPPRPMPGRAGRRVPRWLPVAGRILGSILIYLLGIMVSWTALIGAGWAFDGGQLNVLGVIAALFLLPLWASVFVRRRWPWAPFIAGLLPALGWGDCLLLLIGMFHLVIRARRRAAAAAALIGSVVVIGSVVRMCIGPAGLNPFSLLFLTSDGSVPDPTDIAAEAIVALRSVTIAFGAVALAVSLGFGYLLRRTRRMRSVEAFASQEVQRNEALSAELARQSERELLARELHDTLSHRLSIISLHSGALEVGAKADGDVASTASALRQEAHASLEDLRHLVGGVRTGSFAQTSPRSQSAPPPSDASLRAIPQLIANVQAAGQAVRPSIIMQDIELAPAVLDRAAFRVVQESLTNALKHAPGAPVSVRITVAAATGVRILVSNPVAADQAPAAQVPTATAPAEPPHADRTAPVVPPYADRTAPVVPPAGEDASTAPEASVASAGVGGLAATGTGAGLTGIRERAEVLGGTAEIGVRNGEFVVDVSFPPFDAPARRTAR